MGQLSGSENHVQSAFDLADSCDRERRLSTTLATILGKLSEDASGHIIDGDDEWDMQALAIRRFKGKSLTSCRQSRLKQCVLLILDSSPSCAPQAEFYTRIAQQAAQFGDVEIYDAPNAYLERKWHPRERAWKDISDENCSWDWRGRTIIFFGDYDGSNTVIAASQQNKVHWLNPDLNSYRRRDVGRFKGKEYLCNNEEDLLLQARRMR